MGCCKKCGKTLCEGRDANDIPYWSVAPDGTVSDFHYACKPVEFDRPKDDDDDDFFQFKRKRTSYLQENEVPRPDHLRAQREPNLRNLERKNKPKTTQPLLQAPQTFAAETTPSSAQELPSQVEAMRPSAMCTPLSSLLDMGFPHESASAALESVGGDFEQAVTNLLASEST